MSLLRTFYKDPYLHPKMLAGSLAVSVAGCIALSQIRAPEFFAFQFSWWYVALLPLTLWVGGMSVIVIHNATHNSFPTRPFNRFMGHLAGMQQLWGFTGWKLIHILHHQYTDNADMDIHSPKGMTFAQYCKKMFYFPSAIINKRYFQHWGATPRSYFSRGIALVLFISLISANIYFWYLLFGPAGMLFVFIPAYAMTYFLFAHLNYYGHPVDGETSETHPVNLDEGWYYWIANRVWFGIYYHENHHKKPQLFNPMHMPDAWTKTPTLASATS